METRAQRKRNETTVLKASNGMRHLKVKLRMLSSEELRKYGVSGAYSNNNNNNNQI